MLVETKLSLDSSGRTEFRDARLRVLSLSLVFPNPREPGLGPFVRERLRHLSQSARVKVIAPIAVADYSARRLRLSSDDFMSRRDGELEVFHPGWVFPPGGTPINVLLLLARILPVVRRLHKQFQFDVIDSHFGYPEGAVAAHLASIIGCPFTITLRGSEPMFAKYRYRRLALQWALRRANAVMAVSGKLRDFAIELGADASRCLVIPNGVDKEVYYPQDPNGFRVRHRITPATRVILSAGELIEAKGHHLVIKAVAELVRQGVDTRLFIAGGVARGGRPFERELRRLISDECLEDRVHLLGWLPPEELAQCMSAADVFCLASYTEGWPNVVNEALACGTPVVASDVGAIRQMLPKSEFGSIVPPRDQEALTHALRTALNRSWDRRAIAAWGQSRSWEHVAREVSDVLQKVVTEAYVRN
jgi:teichuronic acid biosynthesis glycosyltransferase TuaC